ncbi:MAG: 16S rRNA (cytosine(1402)-N(4))-methyltransferase RsmH [Bacilli bacterium]|nr:16S rRNA (cytosine(1402)-N(4))-methyltransferase RsmH [Bacilli bacterium]
MENEHYSVLLEETISLLNPKKDGIYVDLTLGRGGTSGAILKLLKDGHLYSFDMDKEAIEKSTKRLESVGKNFTIINSNFAYFVEELKKLGVTKVDGITADLGVSSPQFDEGERGFSYRFDSELDMRMDLDAPLSAKSIVNTYSLEDLTRIFREYGEDQDSYRVAKRIVEYRAKKEIETTFELVDIIKSAKPAKVLAKKGHPAKQIFQALRIETNHELDNLKALLEGFDEILKPEGVIAIISFHSLEDRLVKNRFRELTVIEGDRHALMPSVEDEAPYINLTKRAIRASDKELGENHRSTSALLRAIKKKGESK